MQSLIQKSILGYFRVRSKLLLASSPELFLSPIAALLPQYLLTIGIFFITCMIPLYRRDIIGIASISGTFNN